MTRLDEEASKSYFAYIDSLTATIGSAQTTRKAVDALLYRAITFSMIQDYDYAVDDLTTYLHEDSTSVLALWQRSACQWRINQFLASEGNNTELKNASVKEDLNLALKLSPQHAYLLYNRGVMEAQQGDYAAAIADF
jgi:tetratricopeptide (TPR) repeat protein